MHRQFEFALHAENNDKQTIVGVCVCECGKGATKG